MRTAIVFSALIIARAISTEATIKFMEMGGIVFVALVALFLVMDIWDFGKNRP